MVFACQLFLSSAQLFESVGVLNTLFNKELRSCGAVCTIPIKIPVKWHLLRAMNWEWSAWTTTYFTWPTKYKSEILVCHGLQHSPFLPDRSEQGAGGFILFYKANPQELASDQRHLYLPWWSCLILGAHLWRRREHLVPRLMKSWHLFGGSEIPARETRTGGKWAAIYLYLSISQELMCLRRPWRLHYWRYGARAADGFGKGCYFGRQTIFLRIYA